MKTLGIVLTILGILMMVFTGFNLVTKKEVADIGPVEINKEENNPVSWSPVIGGVLLVSGVALTVIGAKKG